MYLKDLFSYAFALKSASSNDLKRYVRKSEGIFFFEKSGQHFVLVSLKSRFYF